MRPQVCVISVGLTSEMIARELGTLDLPVDFVFNEMLLHETTVLPGSFQDYDVFLSSGKNAQILKTRTDKLVITISPSMYDVLLACSRSLAYGDAPVIILYNDTFSDAALKQLSNMLTVEVTIDQYDDTDKQIEEIILKYKARGHKCVIGSGMVCKYAEQNGMRGIYLFPGELLRSSLLTAANTAASIYQNNSRNLQLSGLINNSKQGIIMLDSQGGIIFCNRIALEYLGADESDVVGHNMGSFFSRETGRSILSVSEATSIIDKIKGRSYVIEIIPLMSQRTVTNRLLYIDDVTQIQKTERDIRRDALAQKGFVAKYTFARYSSSNPDFLKFLSIAKSFARSDEPVVILGETGVGKEVLAQSIHNHSQRASKAFVAVNCAAIPDALLESELFGYNEGAFTGARKGGKEGYFEMAHQGTIFLDEVGDMNTMLQSKLLRVIQEKQVLRVGGTKLIPFDARIIVATNKNLWELVQDNLFRKDLYYRINVLELEIPPLRDRPDDIMMLFRDFLFELAPTMLDAVTPLLGKLSVILSSYQWPGNVRELENLVRSLIAYWKSGYKSEMMVELVEDILIKKKTRAARAEEPRAASSLERQPPGMLKSREEQQIRDTLAACGDNVGKAAELLGIHRSTLWRKMKRFQTL